MTPEQFDIVIKKLDEIKEEASNKGHFFIIVILLLIAVHTKAC